MRESVKIERAVPLREQVLSQVIQSLRSGAFLPGDRLTEKRVAEVLGVSRTPVREALHVLAQRGILTRRDNGGFTVTTPKTKSVQKIFELRRRLEPYAASRAAVLAKPAQLKALGQAIQKLSKLVTQGEPEEFMDANADVRRLLFGMAGNEPLSTAIAQLNDHVHFVGMLTAKSQSVRKLVLAKHKRVFAAISAHDPKAAEKATQEYLDAAARELLAALPSPSEG